MAHYRVFFAADGGPESEVVEADVIEESGQNGKWTDFHAQPLFGSRRLVLRIPTDKISRIERMES